MPSQIINRSRILRHLLMPIQTILARIVPDHLEKALHQESVREAIVTLADQALVSAQPTARLIPLELRQRLIRRQLDVILDDLLLPDSDTEALESP